MRDGYYTYMFWSEKEIEQLPMKSKIFYTDDTFYFLHCKIRVTHDIARYEIQKKLGRVFIDADSLWINKPNNSLNSIIEQAHNKGGMFCAEEPVNKWSSALWTSDAQRAGRVLPFV